MPRRVPPIARIRLARSLPRLLAWPLLATATGAMATATWLTGSFGTGIGGLVFAGLGALLVLIGFAAATVLLSIHLDVEEATVRIGWIGGERLYPLTRGPVTRVRLRGENASKLRGRIGVFGWSMGSARLRDEEEIHVVRLARTPTVIMVPTERGRLAIAAADEDQLLDALSRAARARQRLEELADQAPPVDDVQPPPAEVAPAAEVEPPGPVASLEVEPHLLTGIERALLEQRLAEERAAAEAERTGAGRPPDDAPEPAEPGVPVGPASVVNTAEAATRARRFALRRPRPSSAFVLLPLVGAGAAWVLGIANGTYPAAGTDLGRLTSLALVLAGPATSVGAIMALAWWPRLVGVVVAGGLAASVFIGRALAGA